MPDSHTIVAFMNNIFMTTICDDLIFHSAVDGKRALSQCIYIYMHILVLSLALVFIMLMLNSSGVSTFYYPPEI